MRPIFLIVLSVLMYGNSCSNAEKDTAKEQTSLIVCTTGMIADLLKNIVGDKMEVKALMGPGVDPHLYKATQNDLRLLKDAELIYVNGLHLEGKMASILEKFSRTSKVYAVSDFVDSTRLLKDENYSDVKDPHIWFDVSLWESSISGLVESLCELDPQYCSTYRANASAYSDSLTQLHGEVKTLISSIPLSKRIMITAHDAFNYFGRSYNIRVRGLQGISTLSEFGLKDRVELVNYIVEKQIPLEVCITSNLHTNMYKNLEEHPIKQLIELGFNITLNTDNRLMSNTSVNYELENCKLIGIKDPDSLLKLSASDSFLKSRH